MQTKYSPFDEAAPTRLKLRRPARKQAAPAAKRPQIDRRALRENKRRSTDA